MIASVNVLKDPTPDDHLFDLISAEEWIDNLNEENISCKQMLKKVASTFIEWNTSEPQIDVKEAKIWIQQAEYDYSALFALVNVSQAADNKQHSAAVCFMCQQVAEKSLKAGLYAKCGLKQTGLHTHNLICLAEELEMGSNMVNNATKLNSLYLPTRYPNCHNPSAVPGDEFTSEEAKNAFDIATRIFEAIRGMIDGMGI